MLKFNATVFHKKQPTFMDSDNEDILNIEDYVAVCSLEVEGVHEEHALNAIYRDTNSIDCFWGENENVVIYEPAKKGARSTSVGDLVLINNRFHEVGSFGFHLVNVKE